MKVKKETEQYQKWIAEICPQAITTMRDLLTSSTTPVASKVTLIGMILDRTLGKTETPLRVTTEAESVADAEKWLNEMIREIEEGKAVE